MKEAIRNNYSVVTSVNGTTSVAAREAAFMFRFMDEYIAKGDITEVPFHRYPCLLVDVFISHGTKTIFMAFKEVESDQPDDVFTSIHSRLIREYY